MKKYLKFILLFILVISIKIEFAQTITFKKVYPSFTVYPQFTSTCKSFNNNNSFLISTFAGTTSLILTKINSLGNFVSEKRFLYASDYCNFFFDENKTLILYSKYWNNKVFFKLDTSLNVISAMQYDSINWWQATDRSNICPVYNNGFLLSGGRGISTPLIVKIDSSGNIIWSKYFSPIQGGIQDITQTKDSGFVIAANLNNLGVSLIKTDSGGNVLWSKSYFRPRGYIHNVLENTDGTMIITGNVDSLTMYGSEYNSSPLFFVKLDNIGNVIWAKTFGDTVNRIRNYPSCTKHTLDGGYITLVTLAINDWVDDLLLIKTNANGDTLWVRVHGSIQSFDNGQSIEQLNDKGYIISGLTNNNIPVTLSSLYIVRTDSLGHTDSLCEEYSLPLAINNITVNDSDITVTSVPFTITTSIPDTSTQSFTTYAYDGCHLDDIPELYAEQTAPLIIYPNPTDGLFTVEYKISTQIKTDIEIYNINGWKIYSGFTNESVTDIDLTRQARGLYFVRMSNERWVKTGKVMVY